MTTPLTVPSPTATDRIRRAVADRSTSDYHFHFWSAFGWTLLTFGIYSFYIFYQLMRRSRDHNRRRLALLDAATEDAWQRATKLDKTDELKPEFVQIRSDVEGLRGMDGDSREPIFWLVASIIGGGLVWLAGSVLLDQDLLRHEHGERAAEARLTKVYAALGLVLPAPQPATKQAHNYVGRILAVVFTFGLYSLWWVADLMREGNVNYQQDYAWEDALAQSTSPAAVS